MKIIRLDSVDSTNSWLSKHGEKLESRTIVYSKEQTSGRGQRGNSWESEPGKNITASLLLKWEEFPAFRQFLISEAISLAIVKFLQEYGVEAKVKWPNDIYVDDKKICGILVEHVVMGRNLNRSIAGFGININQEEFKSNAPNPVSLFLLTKKEYNIEEALNRLSFHLEEMLSKLNDEEKLHDTYLGSLWRKDSNYHKFHDKLQEEKIEARITDVEKGGILILETREREKRRYGFKEIEFII